MRAMKAALIALGACVALVAAAVGLWLLWS